MAAEVARARVRKWIDDEGLTQAKAAERLGVSQGAVSQLLKGTTAVPSLALAQAIERETARWNGGPIRSSEWIDQHNEPAYTRTGEG